MTIGPKASHQLHRLKWPRAKWLKTAVRDM